VEPNSQAARAHGRNASGSEVIREALRAWNADHHEFEQEIGLGHYYGSLRVSDLRTSDLRTEED
jgi:Arc/MetJ-type ribon-helix-helix transcriptional regulator